MIEDVVRFTVTVAFFEDVMAGNQKSARIFVELMVPFFKKTFSRKRKWRSILPNVLTELIQAGLFEVIDKGVNCEQGWNPAQETFDSYGVRITDRVWMRWFRDDTTPVNPPCDEVASDEYRTPERIIGHKEYIEKIIDNARREFTPSQILMFELLFIDDLEASAVAELTGMDRDTVYTWRSRLGCRLEKIAAKMDEIRVNKELVTHARKKPITGTRQTQDCIFALSDVPLQNIDKLSRTLVTPLELCMLELLSVNKMNVTDVAKVKNLRPDLVHTWLSSLSRQLEKIAAGIGGEK